VPGQGGREGVAIEPACPTRALLKLQKAFAKADKKEDCIGNGDSVSVQGITDAYAAGLATDLLTPLRCCSLPFGAGADHCIWVEDPGACTGPGGTVGAEGTVCNGDGLCIEPPAIGGPCCENLGVCDVGEFTDTYCTTAGGTYFPDSVCLKNGSASPPSAPAPRAPGRPPR
jgi:hypothetical protein